jgi:uncharacterized membrane protein YidH (DUF202 family)
MRSVLPAGRPSCVAGLRWATAARELHRTSAHIRHALIAAGIALEALALPIQPDLRRTAAIILLLLGLVVPTLAWLTWGAVERALRQGAPLPYDGLD